HETTRASTNRRTRCDEWSETARDHRTTRERILREIKFPWPNRMGAPIPRRKVVALPLRASPQANRSDHEKKNLSSFYLRSFVPDRLQQKRTWYAMIHGA